LALPVTSLLPLVPAPNRMDVLIPKKKMVVCHPLVLAGGPGAGGHGDGRHLLAEAGPAATHGGQPASSFLFHPLAVAAMKAIVGCFFRWVASLALLVLLLRSAQAVSAQTLDGQPSYQATGLRTLIKAQAANSTLVRVRYESNNPGPVYLAFLNDKRCIVYTEHKRETHFVGDYDLAPLPAGDYTLHVSTYGYHHVEALRINRANNSRANIQVIRPNVFRIFSQPVFPSAATN
jgi:hypothetical protein